MVKKILVTIITPCFNSEKTLARTMQSVLDQTYNNFEYIIIDGGSTDRTNEIIQQYERKFAGKLTYVSEPDKGIYDAMNKGIRKMRGDIVGIVNSDDYLEKDAFENIVDHFDGEKNEILYGSMRIWNKNRIEKIVFYHHDFLDSQMINHPTCFVTRHVYEEFGGYDLSLRSSADYEWLLRVSHSKKVKFVPIEAIISNFESGGMSSTEIGVRETAKLRFQYHAISRSRYYFILIRSRLHDLLR